MASVAAAIASALDEHAVEKVTRGPKRPSAWLTAAALVDSGVPSMRPSRKRRSAPARRRRYASSVSRMPPVVAPTAIAVRCRSAASRPASRHASAAAASAKRSARESRRAVAGATAASGTGTASGTSAAMRQRPACAKSVSGPMAQRPSASPVTSARTSAPSAVTAPRPVIATARVLAVGIARRALGALPAPFRRDELDERRHRGERPLAHLLVGDGHAEALLDEHHELERIDRVEPEAVAEDRRIVGDVRRGEIEPQPLGQERLHLGPQPLTIHTRPPLEHREAPVHVQGGPRHVGGGRGSQEHDRGGDLLGRPRTPERYVRVELGAPGRRHAGDEHGLDQPGRDRIHRHAEPRDLARERLRDRHEAALGRGIARRPLLAEKRRRRDHVDDPPPAGGDHRPQRRSGAAVGAEQVGLDHLAPRGLRREHEEPVVGDGSVVHEDVGRAAELRPHRRKERGDRGGLGDVGLAGRRHHAQAAEGSERLLGFRAPLAITEPDCGPFLGAGERDGPPDAAGAAGHEHAPADELHAGISCLSTTHAATWPLEHTSSTSPHSRGASAPSAASTPSTPAAPRVSPPASLGASARRGTRPSAPRTAAARPAPAAAASQSGSKPLATPRTAPRIGTPLPTARAMGSSTTAAAASASGRAASKPPSRTHASRGSATASIPPATIARAAPASSSSAASPTAASPEAAPALSVIAGPPSRQAMASSPAAAFETVAAKSRGLAPAGPVSARRRW